MNLQFFVLASISWILYQCYTAIFLGFMVDIGNLAIAPLFAVLFMLVVGSLFSVIVTHFTPRPAIYNIPEVVDLNRSPLWHIEQVRQELISLTGCNEYHAGRICTTCRALKPERASHCWMCNSCYPRMDHHCVVMGTCVHYKNHKQFNLFIFWLVVTNFFCLVTTVPFVQLGIEKLEWTSDIWIQDYIIRCVNYVVKKYLNRDYLFWNRIKRLQFFDDVGYCTYRNARRQWFLCWQEHYVHGFHARISASTFISVRSNHISWNHVL
ncbi:hypothetical protein M3Y94_00129400 [Aphelenchoides besseyi]|nr:hypothetical protein M3Y94_00129400 [Aphelenchoides besseyi]